MHLVAFVKSNLLELGYIMEIATIYINRLQTKDAKVVETLLGNDAFRYLSTYSILFASSDNSLIPPEPQFHVV